MAAGAQYSTSISVTTSGNAVAFGINAFHVLVINDSTGAFPAYVNFTTTSGATTGDWPLKQNESTSITTTRGHYTGLSAVTSAGVTASPIRVLATR